MKTYKDGFIDAFNFILNIKKVEVVCDRFEGLTSWAYYKNGRYLWTVDIKDYSMYFQMDIDSLRDFEKSMKAIVYKSETIGVDEWKKTYYNEVLAKIENVLRLRETKMVEL